MHSSSIDPEMDEYLGSGKRLWLSMRKHGRENHEREILEFLPDRSSLKNREAEIVNEGMLQDSQCMNLKIGGEGGWSKEVQIKASKLGNEARNKKREDPEWRENEISHMTNISKLGNEVRSKMDQNGELNPFFGKHHTEEYRQNMSKLMKDAQKGEKNSQYGKVWIFNEDLKKSISIKKEDLKRYIKEGWIKGRKRQYKK